MSPPLLQTYADAVSAQGAPLNNCFGFIDETVRPICRPVELQEVVYNGHKVRFLKGNLNLVTVFNNSILHVQNFTLD